MNFVLCNTTRFARARKFIRNVEKPKGKTPKMRSHKLFTNSIEPSLVHLGTRAGTQALPQL
jgi:hypothetical protein